MPNPFSQAWDRVRHLVRSINLQIDQAVRSFFDLLRTFGLAAWDSFILHHGLRDWHFYCETNRYLSPEQPLRIRADDIFAKRPDILDHLYLKPYIHHKLPLAPSATSGPSTMTIRLLELLPFWANAKNPYVEEIICCKIIEVELEEGVEFEALSYAWGPSSASFPVVILDEHAPSDVSKQRIINITPNLFAALKRLRREFVSRLLWIDQLCINQCTGELEQLETCKKLVASCVGENEVLRSDAETLLKSADGLLNAALREKNAQVMIMGDIYKAAKRTLVWLGDDNNDGSIIHTLINGDISVRNSRELAINILLSRDWFGRAWVYQEAVFSKDIEVMSGRLQIKMENLIRLSKSFFGSVLASSDELSVKHTRGMETLYLIEHGRGQCPDANCPKTSLMKNNFLAVLIHVLWRFETSSPHDLIYAFLAFQPEDQQPKIVPRYDLPVAEAWKDAARCLIQSSGNLDIFACVTGLLDEYGLPSWTPFWNCILPYGRPICAPDFQSSFDAAGGRPHQWVSSSASTLIVKGSIICSIKSIIAIDFERPSDTSTNTKEDLLKYTLVRSLIQASINKAGLLSSPSSTHQRHEALNQELDDTLLRTLFADGAFGHNTQPLPIPLTTLDAILSRESTIQTLYNNLSQTRDQDPNPDPDPNSVENRAARKEIKREYGILQEVRVWSLIALGKRLFVSDQFELGLVPESAGEGDLVCVLEGSKVPCVLRKWPDGEGDTYRVISQCYLDGWMYGVVPEGTEVDDGETRQFQLV